MYNAQILLYTCGSKNNPLLSGYGGNMLHVPNGLLALALILMAGCTKPEVLPSAELTVLMPTPYGYYGPCQCNAWQTFDTDDYFVLVNPRTGTIVYRGLTQPTEAQRNANPDDRYGDAKQPRRSRQVPTKSPALPKLYPYYPPERWT